MQPYAEQISADWHLPVHAQSGLSARPILDILQTASNVVTLAMHVMLQLLEDSVDVADRQPAFLKDKGDGLYAQANYR